MAWFRIIFFYYGLVVARREGEVRTQEIFASWAQEPASKLASESNLGAKNNAATQKEIGRPARTAGAAGRQCNQACMDAPGLLGRCIIPG